MKQALFCVRVLRIAAAVLAILVSHTDVSASVLCSRRSGTVAYRTVCRRGEREIDLSTLGLTVQPGPPGPRGPAGPPGPVGVIGFVFGGQDGPLAVSKEGTILEELRPNPGGYLIEAKAWFRNAGLSPISVACDVKLEGGFVIDHSEFTLNPSGAEGLSMGGPIAVPATTLITNPAVALVCRASDDGAQALDLKMVGLISKGGVIGPSGARL